MKDFREHFFLLYNKLKNKENFAFSRFSDGELTIMENQKLVLGENYYQIGNQKSSGSYVEEDRKEFDPEKHGFFHKELMDAYKHKQDNYYVGLSCRCCVGQHNFNKMLNWYEGDIESELLTWSNLWVNSNYALFVEYMIPEFSNHDVVYIVNENANTSKLPFTLKKDFRIGKNCIINDYNLDDDIREWIIENDIKNHVFLFSASSLSNVLIYRLFKEFPKNTYIDIGTTLNPYLDLKAVRDYHNLNGNYRKKTCIW
jgi:hypothetical protein